MKQTLSLILAILAVTSLSVPAFAETSSETAPTSIEARTTAEGISFSADEKTGTKLGDMLTPGKTYNFKLSITDKNGATSDFSSEHMDNHRFTVQDEKNGSAIKSMEVKEVDGDYALQVVTATNWEPKQKEFAATLKYSTKNSGKSIYSNKISFKVGFTTLPDSALTDVAKELEVQVDPATPIITEKQFAKIDKLAEGDKVTFTNDDWAFSVRVTAQEDLNMINNENPIKDIVEKFQDANFKFVSFPAGPQFGYTGNMTINVYEEQDEWNGKFFVYRYYKGELKKVDAKYDKEDGTLSFSTKDLGRFVISDTDFADGTVIESGFGGVDNPNNSNPNTGGSTGNTGGTGGSETSKPNPETGAAGVMGAAALGGLSLVVGAVASKKKRK